MGKVGRGEVGEGRGKRGWEEKIEKIGEERVLWVWCVVFGGGSEKDELAGRWEVGLFTYLMKYVIVAAAALFSVLLTRVGGTPHSVLIALLNDNINPPYMEVFCILGIEDR